MRTILNPAEDSNLDSSVMRTELQTLEEEIAHTTTGHDHDGSDSKTVDHTNLTSKGTNTHSQIDTALSRLADTSGTNTGDQTIPVKATGAEINTGTDDAKFATAKAITDSNVAFTSDIPTKASGSDITTGTDDAKFLTSKALADATTGKLGDSWTSYSATIGGFTGTPTQTIKYFRLGKIVFMSIYITGTSNATTFTVSLPVQAATNMQNEFAFKATDNGTLQSSPGMVEVNGSDTSISFYKTFNAGSWTNSGTKACSAFIIYESI